MASLFLRALTLVPLIGLFSILEASPLRVIAVTGQLAPDGNGRLDTFSRVSQNNAGQVALFATLTNTTAGGRAVYRSDSDHRLLTVVREGDTFGEEIVALSPCGGNRECLTPLNDRGDVAFMGSRQGEQGLVPRITVWRGNGQGELIAIAAEGMPSPTVYNGSSTVFDFTLEERQSLRINGTGTVLFRGFSSTAPIDGGGVGGLYAGDGRAIPREIAASGQSTPGDESTYGGFNSNNINDHGDVAFSARVPFLNDSPFDGGIYLTDSNGTTQQVAGAGQAAPGGDGRFGSGFGGATDIALNNRGQVAFPYRLAGNSGGEESNKGIFLYSGPDNTETIARKGQTTPDGLRTITEFDRDVRINEQGHVGFSAFFDGSRSQTGLFINDGTQTRYLLGVGDTSPDGNGIVAYTGLPAMNDRGEVAFFATLDSTDGGLDDQHALFFANRRQEIITIARGGDPFLGSAIADLRLLTSNIYNNLNNSGQVAFKFTLADGREGIAVWSIPEPATLLLAVFCLFAGVAQQRRR